MDDARALLAEQRLSEAEAMIVLAIEEDAPHRDSLELLANIRRQQAEAATKSEDWPLACDRHQAAADAEPSRLKRHADLMAALDACERASRPQRDLADLAERAVTADPTSVEAHHRAASYWDEAGETERALPHYLWLWEADRSQTSIGVQLGVLYLLLQRYEDAEAVLERVLAQEPTNVQAALNRAEALEARGRHTAVYAAFDTLLEQFPDHAGILFRYAAFLDRRGESIRADALRQQARDGLPGVERREMRRLR